MGINNSSRTRVQPIFKELERRDPLGTTWLARLMRLGSRKAPASGGTLAAPPCFEFPAPPPRDFLRWLVEHPEKLESPSYKVSANTKRKRDGLRSGEPGVREQALAAIDDPSSNHRGKWWCLEGTTMVDCALFTKEMVLFVEGKRTELEPSPHVSWYRGRNQVLRNLDCARWYGKIHGLDYYALLIIEDGDAGRKKKASEVDAPRSVSSSLPHLPAPAREEAMRHYLGFATWRAFTDELDLPGELLA
jgi:hypothetical protein